MTVTEKLIAQLDKDQPNWEIEWATAGELRTFALGVSREELAIISDRLKVAVAQRLFHRILNASIGAGLMVEVDNGFNT